MFHVAFDILKGDSILFFLLFRNNRTNVLICVFEVNMTFKQRLESRFGICRTISKSLTFYGRQFVYTALEVVLSHYIVV